MIEKSKQVLLQNEQKKLDKERKTIEKKKSIMSELREHSEPCSSPQEVDSKISNNLVLNKGKKVKALKAEIQYHKIVLMNQNKDLKVGGSHDELTSCLKTFLVNCESVALHHQPEV